MLDFLKSFFNGEALNFDDLTSAIEAYNADPKNKDKQIKPIDLNAGGYVSKEKFDGKIEELNTANGQITTLSNTVKEFEGVDVKELQMTLDDLQAKYDADVSNLESTIKKKEVVDAWLDSHPSKHRGLLKTQFDLSKIDVDDAGKVIGVEEQGTIIQENYKDLFVVEQDGAGGMQQGGSPKGKDPNTMSMEEYKAWRAEQ